MIYKLLNTKNYVWKSKIRLQKIFSFWFMALFQAKKSLKRSNLIMKCHMRLTSFKRVSRIIWIVPKTSLYFICIWNLLLFELIVPSSKFHINFDIPFENMAGGVYGRNGQNVFLNFESKQMQTKLLLLEFRIQFLVQRKKGGWKWDFFVL
jgi:hypothetical protein